MSSSNSCAAGRRRNFGRALAHVALVLAVALAALPGAQAQDNAKDYPSRAVKIIVPFPAGGTADVMPRVFADWLSRKWGQPVVIENRTGAAGNIGAEAVFRSEPDGYTLLSAPPPPLVINHNLYPKLGFDPTEFVPIIIMGRVPNALVVNPKVAANTVAEVIAYARANPGKLTSATQGNGATSHLTSELFQLMAQVRVQHVPYRGSAPALNDLVGGSVEMMFDNLGVSLPLVRSGKLKLIAVATPKRMASLPDVPTMAETLPGFESAAWFGVVAPPGTAPAIVGRINADMNEAMRQPEIMQRLAQLSAEPIGGTPQATAAYMREDSARWHKVIKDANVKLD
jgi:tripartite-type tricarboxylate transporter receptor subunit TctC